MPRVGNKKYPYTEAGIKAAAKDAKTTPKSKFGKVKKRKVKI